jgi:hypothetical protein
MVYGIWSYDIFSWLMLGYYRFFILEILVLVHFQNVPAMKSMNSEINKLKMYKSSNFVNFTIFECSRF